MAGLRTGPERIPAGWPKRRRSRRRTGTLSPGAVRTWCPTSPLASSVGTAGRLTALECRRHRATDPWPQGCDRGQSHDDAAQPDGVHQHDLGERREAEAVKQSAGVVLDGGRHDVLAGQGHATPRVRQPRELRSCGSVPRDRALGVHGAGEPRGQCDAQHGQQPPTGPPASARDDEPEHGGCRPHRRLR